MMHRVFLVEDHPVMREGYVSLINSEPDLGICGEATSAEEGFSQTDDLDVDIVVVDLSLPGVNGIELIKRFVARDPDVKILVVSAHDEALYAERALHAGARGYLMKHESASRFIDAIRTVLSGDLYLSDAMRTRFLHDRLGFGKPEASASEVGTLTDRELEVFEQFGRGKSTREVAEALGLSAKTIESHRTNIKRKLGIANAIEFAQRAVLWVESPFQS